MPDDSTMAQLTCRRRRRPSFWRVIQHCLRSFRGLTPMATIGVILLVSNVPIGWGGGAICAAMGAQSGDKRWYAASGIVYALSWVMLGLGTILAGPQVAKRFKKRCGSAWRAWRRGKVF